MPILDCVTSIFAGMVIFTYLGYTAHITDKDMEDVVAQGQSKNIDKGNEIISALSYRLTDFTSQPAREAIPF